MPRTWTLEQKTKQAELIHNWQPWQHSTGAKTHEGKAISSMNAEKGYWRRRVRFSAWLLRTRKHCPEITPEIIIETFHRAEKLNCFTADDAVFWLNEIGIPIENEIFKVIGKSEITGVNDFS